MKSIGCLFLCLVLIQSCNNSLSKEKSLTGNKWLLHHEYISPNPDPNETQTFFTYKKDDSALELKFEIDGSFLVIKKGIVEKYKWQWKDDKKAELIISPDLLPGSFMFSKVSDTELTLSFVSKTSDAIKTQTFKPIDSQEWSR